MAWGSSCRSHSRSLSIIIALQAFCIAFGKFVLLCQSISFFTSWSSCHLPGSIKMNKLWRLAIGQLRIGATSLQVICFRICALTGKRLVGSHANLCQDLSLCVKILAPSSLFMICRDSKSATGGGQLRGLQQGLHACNQCLTAMFCVQVRPANVCAHLTYCKELVEEKSLGWVVSRTRTMQTSAAQ